LILNGEIKIKLYQHRMIGYIIRTLRLWDVDSQSCLKIFFGHLSRIWNITNI